MPIVYSRGIPEPHGGRLVNRVLNPKKRERASADSEEMHALDIGEDVARDVVNIAHGIFSPLEGFLLREDMKSVLYNKRLADGTAWTIPMVLDVTSNQVRGVSEGDDVVLKHNGMPIAILHVEEMFGLFDKEEYAEQVYGTTDEKHPGVRKTIEMNDILVGGRIDLVQEPTNLYAEFRLLPSETRRLFKDKGWTTVVGFQTRNVPHLGHESVQKSALTLFDGLFINPVIGRKKEGDFRDEIILEAYRALIENYYPSDRVILGIFQTEMRYAGPREAVFHATVRKNFGCTHFIVGRDHAGVGGFYSPYAAQEIFKEFPDLGISPLFFTSFFYCKRCESIANEKTCPHPQEDRVEFSGTRMRKILSSGETPPTYMVRPEVYKTVQKWNSPFIEEEEL